MKKMRRLIPAVAMLMVAAVMLSTASFAWFTMNEQVTASGMQIQAKATGSLLISQEPFSDTVLGETDVVINSDIETLLPMAYSHSTLEFATLNRGTNGWFVPADNGDSNSITGANTGDYEQFDAWNEEYSYKEEFYIATAGEAFGEVPLTITLTSPVHPATGETHKAYAAAIYVIEKNDTTWLAGKDIGTDAEPDVILYVDEYDSRNTIDLDLGSKKIPSIAGATADNNVGLKVIVHFYVDGALQAEGTTKVNIGTKYKGAQGSWTEGVQYFEIAETLLTLDEGAEIPANTYTKVEGVYTPVVGNAVAGTEYYSLKVSAAAVNDDVKQEGATIDAQGWFVTAGVQTVTEPYCYVRSADIPSNGSTLQLSFSAKLPTD